MPRNELCRSGGLSDATSGSRQVSEAGCLSELASENTTFKRVQAAAHLDMHALKSVLGRSASPAGQARGGWAHGKPAVRERKNGKRPISERVPLQLARTGNEVWGMDDDSDSLAGGRRLKYLTAADEFTHESLDIVGDFGSSGAVCEAAVRARTALLRGFPKAVACINNSPEITNRAFMAWDHRPAWQRIAKKAGHTTAWAAYGWQVLPSHMVKVQAMMAHHPTTSHPIDSP